MLLEHQAQGCIRKGHEQVVVLVEAVGIAWERVQIQLELVVGGLGRQDAALIELGLYIAAYGGKMLQGTADEDIEVRIDDELGVRGDDIEDILDVGLGDAVAGVGHGAMALGLALQLPEQLSLLGNLHDLVVDDAVRIGNLGQEGQKVGGDAVAVDGHALVGLDAARQVYLVDVDKGERPDGPGAHPKVLVRGPEVLHREGALAELHGHIAVQVLLYLLEAQLMVPDAALGEDVHDLGDLDMEVQPLLLVVFHEVGVDGLLGDDEEGADLRIGPSLEILEVAP